MSHLDLNAPALARCNRCGRSTWSPGEVGTEDRMPQPDRGPCGGTFGTESSGSAKDADRG